MTDKDQYLWKRRNKRYVEGEITRLNVSNIRWITWKQRNEWNFKENIYNSSITTASEENKPYAASGDSRVDNSVVGINPKMRKTT